MSRPEVHERGAGPVRVRRGRGRRRSPLRAGAVALLVCLATAPLLGTVWWLAAPGGARPADDGYVASVQAVGGADALFALLCVVAGAVLGLWWVLVRGGSADRRSLARLAGLLVGGLVAGALARAVGVGLETLVGSAAAGTAPELVSVSAVAGVLLWPLATSALVFVDTLRDLVTGLIPGAGGPVTRTGRADSSAEPTPRSSPRA